MDVKCIRDSTSIPRRSPACARSSRRLGSPRAPHIKRINNGDLIGPLQPFTTPVDGILSAWPTFPRARPKWISGQRQFRLHDRSGLSRRAWRGECTCKQMIKQVAAKREPLALVSSEMFCKTPKKKQTNAAKRSYQHFDENEVSAAVSEYPSITRCHCLNAALFIYRKINCKFLSHFDSETAALALRLIAVASISFDEKPFASVFADKGKKRKTEGKNVSREGKKQSLLEWLWSQLRQNLLVAVFWQKSVRRIQGKVTQPPRGPFDV